MRERDTERRSDRPHPTAAAANPVCTYLDKSRENRGFGWTFPGPVDRGGEARLGVAFNCCEAPAHAQVPVPVPGLALALARIRSRPQRPQRPPRLACTADHSAHRRNHVVLPHDITAVRPAAARPQIPPPLIVTSRPFGVSRLRLRDACPSSLSSSARIAGQCRCMEPLKPTPNPPRLVPFSNPLAAVLLQMDGYQYTSAYLGQSRKCQAFRHLYWPMQLQMSGMAWTSPFGIWCPVSGAMPL